MTVRIIQTWAERVRASHEAFVNGLSDADLVADPETAPKPQAWFGLHTGAQRCEASTPAPDDVGDEWRWFL